MCFHRWSKWESYEEKYYWQPGITFPEEYRKNTYKGLQIRQKRQCKKCKKIQDKLIRKIP